MTLDQVDELMASGPVLLAFLVSVLAGLVSFASPCVVPLVPGYDGDPLPAPPLPATRLKPRPRSR